MRVEEKSPERLVLRERAAGLYGVFTFVAGVFLLGAMGSLLRGYWIPFLFMIAIPSLGLFLLLKSAHFVTVFTFDKRQGTLEIARKHFLFGERRLTERLEDISFVDIVEVSGQEGRSFHLRLGLRSKEPILLCESGWERDLSEQVQQIRGFLDLAEDPSLQRGCL